MTPKPNKKNHRSKAPANTDDDLPAPPPTRVPRLALTDKEDEEDSPESPLTRKGAKKDKGKGKEMQPDKKGRTATATDADQTRDRNVPKAKMSVLVLFHSHLIRMSLLSLNQTTLYYHFLSDRTSIQKTFATGINNWVENIPDNADPLAKPGNKVATTSAAPTSRKKSKVSKHGSNVPALTNATSRSSQPSVLSHSIKISQNDDVKVKTQAQLHDTSIEIIELGLEDDDETKGVEREAALKSPPKGKGRISSAVTNQFYFPSPSRRFTVY
jgi:hypothetical protein